MIRMGLPGYTKTWLRGGPCDPPLPCHWWRLRWCSRWWWAQRAPAAAAARRPRGAPPWRPPAEGRASRPEPEARTAAAQRRAGAPRRRRLAGCWRNRRCWRCRRFGRCRHDTRGLDLRSPRLRRRPLRLRLWRRGPGLQLVGPRALRSLRPHRQLQPGRLSRADRPGRHHDVPVAPDGLDLFDVDVRRRAPVRLRLRDPGSRLSRRDLGQLRQLPGARLVRQGAVPVVDRARRQHALRDPGAVVVHPFDLRRRRLQLWLRRGRRRLSRRQIHVVSEVRFVELRSVRVPGPAG